MLLIGLFDCTGFVWYRMDFLCSSLRGDMLWVFDQSNANNRDVLASTEKCLYRADKAFVASYIIPPASRLGEMKKFGKTQLDL